MIIITHLVPLTGFSILKATLKQAFWVVLGVCCSCERLSSFVADVLSVVVVVGLDHYGSGSRSGIGSSDLVSLGVCVLWC